jgi:hypothetical protein
MHVHLGGPLEASVHTSWRPAFGGVAPTFATFGRQAQCGPTAPTTRPRPAQPRASTRQETAFYRAGGQNILTRK